MEALERKARLGELRRNDINVVMTGIPLRYRGDKRIENVYKIPLCYLIYNKYNGRIGTDVLSYERQNGILDPEKEIDSELIEKFLFDSKIDRNKTTMKSLKEDGQQRYGIVTADGIIVDGNRRAMLLNKVFRDRGKTGDPLGTVEHCQYFLAIILPEDASERDIQQLETIYQMGEDAKLDYNPIEKYLKCKALKEYFSVKDIAGFMGEKPNQINKWLSILGLMEEYLEEYGYEGIYTRLEKTEGPFVDLDGYIDSYQSGTGAGVRNVDWEYSESDISDMKTVCFDYIRARYEGKDFRQIAKTGRDGSIFFHKDLWSGFLSEHSEKVPKDKKTVDEMREEFPDEDLSNLLRKRDADWINEAKDQLVGNLGRFTRKLEDKRAFNKPAELLERALSALELVDYKQDSFYKDPNIEYMVKEINKICWEMKKLLDRR